MADTKPKQTTWTRIPPPITPSCDLCWSKAKWAHSEGGLRCGRCYRPEEE